jgi:hypothetical protein
VRDKRCGMGLHLGALVNHLSRLFRSSVLCMGGCAGVCVCTLSESEARSGGVCCVRRTQAPTHQGQCSRRQAGERASATKRELGREWKQAHLADLLICCPLGSCASVCHGVVGVWGPPHQPPFLIGPNGTRKLLSVLSGWLAMATVKRRTVANKGECLPGA